MAYPPVIPPNNRANATDMVDAHASDHNALANALTAMPWGYVIRPTLVTVDQSGIGATVVDLAGFTASPTLVLGRWYRLSWLALTYSSAAATFVIFASLDGTQLQLAAASPPASNY